MFTHFNDFKYFFTLDGSRQEITFAPVDWESSTVLSYKRSPDYKGLVRSLAFPMRVVHDGANLLKTAFNKYGYEAEVIFEVAQLVNKDLTYDLIFKGNVDCSKIEIGEHYVTFSLMESGLSELISSKDNVKYEFPLTGPDVVNIILPGIEFSSYATWIFTPTPVFDLNAAKKYVPGLNLMEPDSSGFTEAFNVEFRNAADSDNFSGDGFIVGHRETGVNIKVTGTVKGVCVNGIPFNSATDVFIEIRRLSNNSVVHTILSESQDFAPNEIRPFDKSFDFDINLPNEEKLYMYVRTDTNSSAVYCKIDEGEFKIAHTSVSDPSNCKGIKAMDLYARLMARISPGTPINSRMIKSTWSNLIFTSGDGIREIAKAKIKISFKDFFETFDSIDDAGFGIENGIACLENSNYFFRHSGSINLTNIKGLTIKPATDYLFNSLRIGYDDGNTEDTDGREEFNSQQEWDLTASRVQAVKEFISPTRADQYGIEKIRIDYNVKKGNGSTDTSSDNDVFMIDCYIDGDNFRPILGSSYQEVSGITSGASSYNLRLSPKQSLLRHGGLLRAVMDRMEGRYINFASGTKNTELLTIKDGIRVKENENIQVSSLNGKYFAPYLANFTGIYPRNPQYIIDKMPYNAITFEFDGQTFKGFLIDITIDLAKKTEREFTVLLHPDSPIVF